MADRFDKFFKQSIIPDLKTSIGTDMGCNLIANTEVLKPENERLPYQKKSTLPKFNNINNQTNDHNNNNNASQHSEHKSEHKTEQQDYTEKKNNNDDDENLTEDEYIQRQLDMLRKLGELTQQGIKLSQNYNIKSDYKMMKYEYDLRMNIKNKTMMVNLLNVGISAMIGLFERMNDSYNWFGIKFNGEWTKHINSNQGPISDALSELYEKYSSPTTSPSPELKLILALGISCVTTVQHIKNSSTTDNTLNELEKLKKQQQELELNKQKQDLAQKEHQLYVQQQQMQAQHQTRENKEHDALTQQLQQINEIKQKNIIKKSQLDNLSAGLNFTESKVLSESDSSITSDSENSVKMSQNKLISHVSSIESNEIQKPKQKPKPKPKGKTRKQIIIDD